MKDLSKKMNEISNLNAQQWIELRRKLIAANTRCKADQDSAASFDPILWDAPTCSGVAGKQAAKVERINGKFKPIEEPKQRLKTWAGVDLVWPKLTKADRRKLSGLEGAIKSALQSAKWKLANSSHWVQSSGEWVRKDRLESLTNAIRKANKLNAGVLDNPSHRDWLIDLAWFAYGKLETDGTDNAHFEQGGTLPTDDKGREDIYKFRRADRRLPELPDSHLDPESQWLALELADTFNQPERKPIERGTYLKPTKCKRTAKPLPTSKPWDSLPLESDDYRASKPVNAPRPEWSGEWEYLYTDGSRTSYRLNK